jgi:hypothetical protein
MTIDRRSLLQAGLTSAAVGSVSIAAAGTAAAQSTSKTYVLVHGAWHGGWCWKEAADGLRGMGHSHNVLPQYEVAIVYTANDGWALDRRL